MIWQLGLFAVLVLLFACKIWLSYKLWLVWLPRWNARVNYHIGEFFGWNDTPHIPK